MHLLFLCNCYHLFYLAAENLSKPLHHIGRVKNFSRMFTSLYLQTLHLLRGLQDSGQVLRGWLVKGSGRLNHKKIKHNIICTELNLVQGFDSRSICV